MAQFQIIQLKDPASPSTLQFPVTPAESLVQSINERTTPLIIMLSQWSDTLTTPTEANQYAYKPTSKLVCVSSASGSSFVWSAGTAPVAGKLYMREGTLYVKSAAGGNLSILQMP